MRGLIIILKKKKKIKRPICVAKAIKVSPEICIVPFIFAVNDNK